MLKLDVFSVANRQTVLALLNLGESAGITDVRFLRVAIEKSIAEDLKVRRLETISSRKEDREYKKQLPRCPKCNSIRWRTSMDVDGTLYILCKDCQYSELVGEK